MQITPSPLSSETQTLLKAKAEQFELMMQERVAENNALLDELSEDAKQAPKQEPVDMQDLLAQIVNADDGKMPSEKSRHNLVDPDPIDVLNFCVSYMDDTDAKIDKLTKKNSALESVLHDFIAGISDEKMRQHLLLVTRTYFW